MGVPQVSFFEVISNSPLELLAVRLPHKYLCFTVEYSFYSLLQPRCMTKANMISNISKLKKQGTTILLLFNTILLVHHICYPSARLAVEQVQSNMSALC